MQGKYIFLICFVSVDVVLLSAYLGIYLHRRQEGRRLPGVIWASYPLLIGFLVLVPVVIIFEDTMVTVILSIFIIAGYITLLFFPASPRGPRGWPSWGKRSVDPFSMDDEEEKLPF
jgi:uncharacterized membrane protein YfcA